jgi:hypothetical protein
VIFEVFAGVRVQIVVFSVVTQCSLQRTLNMEAAYSCLIPQKEMQKKKNKIKYI